MQRVPAAADLPDVNVWLAISVPDHPHHARARRYWHEEAADRIWFCRITCLGYVRLSTTPAAMQGSPLTVPQAWNAYRAFCRLPEVAFAPEPPGCETLLESWAADGAFSARQWTDAYLAAFARVSAFRVVSFDRDFARFERLDFLHLGL